MATYYWVNGTGTWDASSVTNWSSTSGTKTAVALAPGSGDTVIIDSASGTGTITCTGALCADLTVTATQAITLGAASSTLSVYGNLSFPSTGSFAINSGLTTTFKATSAKTVNTGAKAVGPCVFDGVGGTWTLGSNLGSTSTIITLTNGTLDTNNYIISASYIGLGVGTKQLNLNASTVSLSGTTGLSFSTNSAGFTLNAGTSTINLSAQLASIATAGLTFYNVNFTYNTPSAAAFSISGNNAFNNLTVAGPLSTAAICKMSLGGNQIINGTLSINSSATTYSQRFVLQSDTLGTPRSITANQSQVTIAYCDFRDITAIGTTWSGTSFGNCLGNTNITFDTPKAVYWVYATSTTWNNIAWSNSPTGTPSAQYFPLAQDTAIFTDSAGNSGITASNSVGYNIGGIDFSQRTTLPITWSTNNCTIYKNVVFSSMVTLAGAGSMTFSGQGTTQTIKSSGVSISNGGIIVASPNGTVKLLDTLTTGLTLVTTLTSGNLDLNNFQLTTGFFISNVANTRTILFGTGNITVSGAGGTLFSLQPASFSYTGTPTINISYSGSNAVTVDGKAPLEPGALDFNFTAGTYVLNFLPYTAYCARNVNFTGFSGSWGVSTTQAPLIYGDLTLSPTMNFTASTTGYLWFAGTSGTKKITTNGRPITCPIKFDGVGSTWVLQDDFNMDSTRTLTHANGILDLNGKTLTVGTSYATAAGTKTLVFNGGTLVCPASTTTAFNTAGLITALGTSGTFGKISLTGSTAKTFVGGGSTYNCILEQAGAGDLTITGANTFIDITSTVPGNKVILPASTTTTVRRLSLSGTDSNKVTLTSSTTTKAALVSNGNEISTRNLNISYITAGTLPKWRAPTNLGNTDGGNNLNWNFDSFLPSGLFNFF